MQSSERHIIISGVMMGPGMVTTMEEELSSTGIEVPLMKAMVILIEFVVV